MITFDLLKDSFEPPRFLASSIFSSFFFSKGRRAPHVQVFPGGSDGVDTYGRVQRRSPCGKECNEEKAKLKLFFFVESCSFPLKRSNLYEKNLHARNLCQICLRSLLFRLRSTTRAAAARTTRWSGRQPCRQQAAKDPPFLKRSRQEYVCGHFQ